MNKRNRYNGIFKARVAIEALKGDKTLAELSNKYQIHSNQIMNWKSKLIHNASNILKTRDEKGRMITRYKRMNCILNLIEDRLVN